MMEAGVPAPIDPSSVTLLLATSSAGGGSPCGNRQLVQPGRVEAEDLPLRLQRQVDPLLLLDVLRQLEGHEPLDQPLGTPECVVGSEEEAFLPEPPQQLGDYLGEVPRLGVDEGHDHGESAIDVGLLGGDPAEVLQPGQAAVLDDEAQLVSVDGRHLVHVGDIERVPVQWPDRWSLVHVDVDDPELCALVQIPSRPGIRELPALGVSLPLRGVEFDPLEPVALDLLLEGGQPLGLVARVPAAAEHEPFRMLLLEDGVLLERVEAVDVEVLERGREEDRDVDIPLLEEVTNHALFGVLAVLLQRPDVLRRAQVPMVVVETVDPALSVLRIPPVRGAGVPEVYVPVDDEDVFAVVSVHQHLLVALPWLGTAHSREAAHPGEGKVPP